MRLAMIGLGRMGANMARRLHRSGIEVIGHNRSREATQQLAAEGAVIAADTLGDAVARLRPPRVVWLMLPAGEATGGVIDALADLLEQGDVVVDGGNSYYRDTLQRGSALARHGLRLVDVGTSGGVWGLEEGYCLMVGGEREAITLLAPALQALGPPGGWAHVGPLGAGHYTKMIHNGIEYGMMQAMAEGFELLRNKREFDLDLAQVAELWRHGSVVRSWLLDLTADFLAEDPALADVAPFVADSGEGRWTVKEAVDQGVAVPVLGLALAMRFASQDQRGYSNRMLAAMRRAFGGHAIKQPES